jgi:hypothetical protein
MSDLPDNWTQQASDTLRSMVERALDMAKANPGEWVNPTPLDSQVRYDPRSRWYEIYGRYTPDMEPAELPPEGRSMAATVLFHSWAEDLRVYKHRDRNYRFVEQLKLMHEMGR